MDLGPLRASVNEIVFSTFSVDATVTRPSPDNVPIVTRLVWLRPRTDEMPRGGDFDRNDQRKRVSISRNDVPTMPRDTRIVAAERTGAEPLTWVVDATDPDSRDPYHVCVFVRPLQEPA